MPIDHAGITAPAAQWESVVEFYLAALEPLGYAKIVEFPSITVGLGDPRPDFWITSRDGEPVKTHFAFQAKDRATVDKFYDAAIKAGAQCNGKPGVRPHYDPNYYGAFVIDPLGHNLEAVCRSSE